MSGDASGQPGSGPQGQRRKPRRGAEAGI